MRGLSVMVNARLFGGRGNTLFDFKRKGSWDMFEQVLAFITPHLQLIMASLLLLAVFLELVHIGQVRRIHKKINYAGRCLQKYLDTVFYEEEGQEDPPAQEDLLQDTREALEKRDGQKEEQTVVQVDASKILKSRQEENMRVSLAHKKLQRDGELLDTVLQEIFD